MDDWIWIAVVVVVVVVALVVWSVSRKRRSDALRNRFGPEYDHVLTETGDRKVAESDLKGRLERRDELDIRPLPPATADRYRAEWRDVQARFVDAPEEALTRADGLITSVMRARGYPMDDFEQRSADVSVDHAEVVEDYRAAHAISLANDHGKATTEDLRQGMVHYRSLFEQMLESDERSTSGENR
jgi:hypothetical protein